MHIPDGLLSARVAVGYGAVSLASVGIACHRLRARREPRNAALLGVSAAFVFAAQLVNFPIAAGTSGHLLGGVLATALLGLDSSLIVMSAVLIVQCFVFGDGGVLALGANVFNMALVSCVVGSCLYRVLCGAQPSATRRVAAVAFAAFCATMAAASSAAEQLALSGTARLGVVLPAMLTVHALIAVAESVITALVLSTVLRFRPELLDRAPTGSRSRLWPGLGLALATCSLLAPLSSAAPDGLSSVVARLGLLVPAPSNSSAPVSGYALGGVRSELLATILAGCLGALLLYGLCWLLAKALVPRGGKADATRVVSEPLG